MLFGYDVRLPWQHPVCRENLAEVLLQHQVAGIQALSWERLPESCSMGRTITRYQVDGSEESRSLYLLRPQVAEKMETGVTPCLVELSWHLHLSHVHLFQPSTPRFGLNKHGTKLSNWCYLGSRQQMDVWRGTSWCTRPPRRGGEGAGLPAMIR